MCEELFPLLKDLNTMFATKGRSVLPSGGPLTPTLEARLKELHEDRWLSELFAEGGVGGEAPTPAVGGNYTWGSSLMPWEIAQVGGSRAAVRPRWGSHRWVGAGGLRGLGGGGKVAWLGRLAHCQAPWAARVARASSRSCSSTHP